MHFNSGPGIEEHRVDGYSSAWGDYPGLRINRWVPLHDLPGTNDKTKKTLRVWVNKHELTGRGK